MKSPFYLILCLVALSLGTTETKAQKGKLLRANKLFQQLRYQKAIPLYLKVLKKSSAPDALFNIADCYRKIADYPNAEQWYAQAILHPNVPPEVHFYYGLTLLSNDKVGTAQTQFEQFIEGAPDETRGKNLIKACKPTVRQELMNAGILYQMRNLEKVNCPYDDLGATFYSKGIAFTSERDTNFVSHRRSTQTGRPFTDMYYVAERLIDEDKLEYTYGQVKKIEGKLSSRLHDGPACFAQEDKIVFFTRDNMRGGISNLKIYTGTRSGDKWIDIMELPFNSDQYSCAYPTTTSDGEKMYFASDMDGGFGGMDLYVSYLEGGNEWSAPINLGPEVNTEGDEIFPFLASDGTLYFASDGHTGLGGYDIYFSNVKRGIWNPVTNIGYPMNTRYDDFGITLDSAGFRGFISSNREGGKGRTDLYSFTRRAVETEILVFDKLSGEGIEGIELVSPCFPREVFVTNIDGKVNIDLPLDYSCTFKINSDQYGEKTIDVSTQGYQMRTTLFFDIPLEVTELAFDVNGSVRDKKGNPMAGAEVSLLSSCGNQPQSVTTTAIGDYQFNLAPACCYMLRITAPGYFTAIDTFCTKGFTKSKTFESNVTMSKFWEENMLSNLPDDTSSIYVIDNIYYRSGSLQPTMGPSSGVEDLLTLLRNNPEVGVEVRSHTDSRGNAENNLNLSIKRAEWIAKYLIENGIPKNHVSYKGLGESQLINACSDGVSCSEQEHKLNRRTEFRIMRLRNN